MSQNQLNQYECECDLDVTLQNESYSNVQLQSRTEDQLQLEQIMASLNLSEDGVSMEAQGIQHFGDSESGVETSASKAFVKGQALDAVIGEAATVCYDSSTMSCNTEPQPQLQPQLHPQQQQQTKPASYISDNGSESSCIIESTPATTGGRRLNSGIKKKVAMFESPVKTRNCDSTRSNNLKRAASLPRSPYPVMMTPRNSGVSSITFRVPSSIPSTTPTRSTRNSQKSDAPPITLNRASSSSSQRLVQRTLSLSRSRTPGTPGTPSDDGRWPASIHSTRNITARRGMSVAPELNSSRPRLSINATPTVDTPKPSTPSPYGTLPRRRKQKSVEDLNATGRVSRSNSIIRESRMTASVMLPTRRSLAPTKSSIAKTKPKTRIYHETAAQTALTSGDLDHVFSGGLANARAIDASETQEQEIQCDIQDREIARLREEVLQLTQREHELGTKLQREREEKFAMQQELHVNTERVMGMLELARVVGANAGTPTSEEGSAEGSGHDSLLMLESQIQLSGHELIERQQEIGQLRQLCRSLQQAMRRSLAAQECLLQEKATIEQESSEMQDFLQHEKAAMCDALKELETEYQNGKQQLINREEETKVLRDECRHLVRLNEQRRQENRILQTKFAALESKSKELLLQQNASVSGASTALSNLHGRLHNLVEQLINSYSISEPDLEDISFQSEVAHNGNTETASMNGEENQNGKANSNGLDLPLQALSGTQALQPLTLSSDGSLSPQRNQSFIAAVISAIRNATTTHSGKRHTNRNVKRPLNGTNVSQQSNPYPNAQNEDDSDSTEMLDSETEPCLMMDNVLEDVVQPDTHSHNMVSSCTGMISQIEFPPELVNSINGTEELLQQPTQHKSGEQQQFDTLATQATLSLPPNRERHNSNDLTSHDSISELPSLLEYSVAQSVLQQVMDVDGLITKLLKVLRLLQLDNDNCIQHLILDKNKLQQHKEEMLEKLKELQDVNAKLQDELVDATQELLLKNGDIANSKTEIQRHRNEIDVRF